MADAIHRFVMVERDVLVLAQSMLELVVDAIEQRKTDAAEVHDEIIATLCRMQALLLSEMDEDEVRWEALKDGIGKGFREAMSE